MLRLRSEVRWSGLSPVRHQAGAWGGVVKQGGEAAVNQLSRSRASNLVVESETPSTLGRPEPGS